MDDSTIQVVSILIILFTLVITALLSRPRKRPFPLRRIAAYDKIPSLIGHAIEADRPVHLSLGSAALGGESTLLAIASAELAFLITQRAAIGDVSPILTVSDASALPLAQDSLRRAYQSRGLGDGYKADNTRWYPAGSRSLAFAAAISAMMGDDGISSNVLAGSFGPELALILDAGKRRNTPVVAMSNQLDGQAIGYVFSDELLIGEEVFASASYLSMQGNRDGQSVTTDILRWLVILTMLAGFVLTILQGD